MSCFQNMLLRFRLPVHAISLDFLGVPGSAVASKTLDLVKQHGFPKEKRLGAGVVDGRSVWSDGGVPAALVASLQKQVCMPVLASVLSLAYYLAAGAVMYLLVCC